MPKIPGGLANVSLERPVFPANDYPATITGFEYKTAGTGSQMFAMEVTLREGEANGAKLYENIVVINKDGARNDVGLRRLKKIITWLDGEEAANDEDYDTDQLIGRDCTVSLNIRQGRDPDGSDQKVPENHITRFYSA